MEQRTPNGTLLWYDSIHTVGHPHYQLMSWCPTVHISEDEFKARKNAFYNWSIVRQYRPNYATKLYKPTEC